MKLSVILKEDADSKESYIDLADIAHLFDDVTKLDSYKIQELDDNSLSITFYDKDGALLKIKESK
jgi:hypothetical protein